MGSSNSPVGLSSSSFSFVFVLSIFLIFTINPSSSVQVCKPASCGPLGPPVRFPFRLISQHDKHCGYPGFDLYCNNDSLTILRLPCSGEFVVEWIKYSRQAIFINDPDHCLSKRISNFSADGSAFRAGPGHKVKFFKCSLDSSEYRNTEAVPLRCLDNNSTILVTPTPNSQDMPPTCSLMPNVSIPFQLITFTVGSIEYTKLTLELIWKEPACQTCDLNGLYCGLESDSGLDIGCSKPPGQGLSRGARYGIILGVGILGLVCLIGLVCYVLGNRQQSVDATGPSSARGSNLHSRDATGPSSARGTNPDSRDATGPSSARGSNLHSRDATGPSSARGTNPDSRDATGPSSARGSNPHNRDATGSSSSGNSSGLGGTCVICQSDFRPKQKLRSIPECNHCYHASCLADWLKRDRSCPMCRKQVETSSVSPGSSRPSPFSTSAPV